MELTFRLLSSWHKPGKKCRDLCRYPETLTSFIAALCMFVGCADPRFAFMLKGYEQSEAGDDSSAFESYTAALRIDSTCSKAYFNRGVIYHAVGTTLPGNLRIQFRNTVRSGQYGRVPGACVGTKNLTESSVIT